MPRWEAAALEAAATVSTCSSMAQLPLNLSKEHGQSHLHRSGQTSIAGNDGIVWPHSVADMNAV